MLLITASWASCCSILASIRLQLQMSRHLYLGTLALFLCTLLRDYFKFEVDRVIPLGQQLTYSRNAPPLQGLSQSLLSPTTARRASSFDYKVSVVVCNLWFCFYLFSWALSRQLFETDPSPCSSGFPQFCTLNQVILFPETWKKLIFFGL